MEFQTLMKIPLPLTPILLQEQGVLKVNFE